jgi:adenylosuccinate synthase
MNKHAAVVGAQFGDEGKARVINWLAKDYDVIVRYSGSSNAGHTLYYKGNKIVRHLIPSADFSISNQLAFLGSDMVINPEELLEEIKSNSNLFPNIGKQIIVDPDSFIITENHLKEDRENVKSVGSTGKGVSPAYRDKIYRKGIKFSTLIKDNAPIVKALSDIGVTFKYSYQLYDFFKQSKILFEGAQSILLDKDFGTYPYVTSGNCGINGIINSGFADFIPSNVYGVSKCYSTRVGSGPFPTEISGEEAEKLRKLGNEYGATTGRPRRVGWLDLPALEYACIKGGINKLVFTKFDILDGLDTVPICISYKNSINCGDDFLQASPNYLDLEGWDDAKKTSQLMVFIATIEKKLKREITHISCGAEEDSIFRL